MQTAAHTGKFLMGEYSQAEVAGLENPGLRGELPRYAFLKRLAHSAGSRQFFVEIADKFTRLAESAYNRRDINMLGEVSRVLMNLPLEAARQTGLFYHSLVIKRSGREDEALSLLERVADNGPPVYRARAIQSLGVFFYKKKKDAREAIRFHIEALKAARTRQGTDLLTALMAHMNVSMYRGLEGDHQSALDYLENLWPLVRLVIRQHPLFFYNFHNELAVEYNHLGRFAEAEAACKIALKCPYASAYPEWIETRQEIAAKKEASLTHLPGSGRAAEIAFTPQPEPEPESSPACAVKPGRFVVLIEFLYTSTRARSSGTVTISNAMSGPILDRVRTLARPRAPPSNSSMNL